MQQEQDDVKWRAQRRPLSNYRVVIAGDFHFPYQDPFCLILFLYFLKWTKPDVVVLNGDVLDFYALSRFSKNPKRVLGLQDELDCVLLECLRKIRAILPNARIIYMEGNHEERLTRWLREHPEISSLRALSLDKLLEFSALQIAYYPYNKRLELADFVIWHGDRVAQNSGYTAASYARNWRVTGVFNHVHRMGTHYVSSVGQNIICYENGCMCSSEVEYVRGGVPNWQKGFGVLTIQGGRGFFEPIHIYPDYTMIYHGNLISLRSQAA